MTSPILYFKRNPKNPILIIAISSLAVLVISLTVAIISSIRISTERVVINQFTDYSVVIYNETDDKADAILMDSLPNTDLYKVSIDFVNFETAFGTNSTFLYSFFDDETLQSVFNYSGMKITNGRMPKNGSSEIILHESILKNRNLSIGDKLNNKEIVGSMDGDKIVGYSFLSDEEKGNAGFIAPAYIIVSKDSDIDKIRKTIDDFDEKLWQTFTYTALSKKMTDEMSTLNLIMLMIVFMIVSCLSIAVSALIFTIYSGRYDEFAILNAMGYKKGLIRLSIISEIVILSVFSWIIGYALSWVGMIVVNETIYKDLGQQMPLFNMQGLCYSLLLPILSILCAVLPVSHKLSKTDLIGIIERR